MKRLHGTQEPGTAYTTSPEKSNNAGDIASKSHDEKVITFTSAGKPVAEMQNDSTSAPHINVDAHTVFTVATADPWYKKIYIVATLIVFVAGVIGLMISNFTIGTTSTTVVAPSAMIAPSVSEDIARQIILAENGNHEENAAFTPSAISDLPGEYEDSPFTPVENIVSAEVQDVAQSGALKPDTHALAIKNHAVGHDNAEMRIIRGKVPDRTGSLINAAYTAYVAGNYSDATQVYLRVLQDMPGHRDALLGMAAIALRKGDSDEACRYWLRVLTENPDDPVAMTGLINLMIVPDFTDSARAIKALLLDYPHAAFLYFSLGNLHAAVSDWPEAYQAFAEASRLERDNPDYAYNLAVSLEHLGDKEAALGKYKIVQELARDRQVHFNDSVLPERISILSEAENDR